MTNMGKKPISSRSWVLFLSRCTTVGIVSVTNEYIQCNGMYGGMVDVDLISKVVDTQ